MCRGVWCGVPRGRVEAGREGDRERWAQGERRKAGQGRLGLGSAADVDFICKGTETADNRCTADKFLRARAGTLEISHGRADDRQTDRSDEKRCPLSPVRRCLILEKRELRPCVCVYACVR